MHYKSLVMFFICQQLQQRSKKQIFNRICIGVAVDSCAHYFQYQSDIMQCGKEPP